MSRFSNLMESRVDFVAVDMPAANRLTIHILAAVAEHERETISKRTQAALRAAKKFIATTDSSHEEATQEDDKKIQTMLRFYRDLLKRIDAAAKHRGISRSSWIQFTLSRALDQGEG